MFFCRKIKEGAARKASGQSNARERDLEIPTRLGSLTDALVLRVLRKVGEPMPTEVVGTKSHSMGSWGKKNASWIHSSLKPTLSGMRRWLTAWSSKRPTLFFRCLLLLAVLFACNLLLWIAALTVAPPTGPNSFASLCLLAWTTGLRHALDADHITAIDNATRRIVGLPVSSTGSARPRWRHRAWRWLRRKHHEQGKDDSEAGGVAETEETKGPSSPSTPAGAVDCRRPITCGLFFSLGHSTIVVAVTIAISISISVASRLDAVGGIGGIIGQSVSGSFLMIVAIINTFILISTLRKRREAAKRAQKEKDGRDNESPTGKDSDGPPEDSANGQEHTSSTKLPHDGDESSEQPKGMRTIFTRLVGPLLRLVTQPYHMYPIGVLFGLGFDTASTIALLSISAVAGSRHFASEEELSGSDAQTEARGWHGGDAKVVLLALLFTAGMTFVDSCDSVLMIYAYAPPTRPAGGERWRWWSLWERASPKLEQRSPTDVEKGGVSMQTGATLADNVKPEAPLVSEQSGRDTLLQARSPTTTFATASTAQTLSLLLTLLSIFLAFAISCIVLLSLIASNCTECAAAAEAHDAGEGGGLAGRWWSFWLKAGDASGYIGAGIVAVFLVVVIVYWGSRSAVRRYRRRQTSVTSEADVV